MNRSHTIETHIEMYETESTDSTDSMDIEYTVVDNNIIIDKKLFTHLTTLSRQIHELKTLVHVLQSNQDSLVKTVAALTLSTTDMSNRLYIKTSPRPSWLGH